MMSEKIRSLFRSSEAAGHEKQISKRLAEDAYPTEMLLGFVILAMQSFMLLLFLFKPGGPFTTWRRTSYFCLYLLLTVMTVIFLWVRRSAKNADGRRQHQISFWYSILICLWACAITFLDQFGGNGLIVYCYMLPTLAALALLTPKESVFFFSGFCVLLNVVLPFLPGGMHNLFSNLVNSIVISFLSVIISWRLYQARFSSLSANLIIEQQMEEIQKINHQLIFTNEQLSQLAITDPLTGMNNRRYLEENVRDHLKHLPRDFKLAGMMIDIDFFKKYNDDLGHLSGDECLKEIADTLIELTEQENMYAVRYGGEEFFIFMIRCNQQTALKHAGLLRQRISELSLSSGRQVTVSIGLALNVSSPQFQLEQLINDADLALYEAKKEGRNRVVVYDSQSCHGFSGISES